MTFFWNALSTWLHLLATIVFIGYDFFTGLVYLPIFEKQMDPASLRALLERISKRMQPFFGASILIFLATGAYLMLINKNYAGLGQFFSNPWSSLIVVKHVLVIVFLALGIYGERAFLPKIGAENPKPLRQFRLALNVNVILGALILLLTAIAQVG